MSETLNCKSHLYKQCMEDFSHGVQKEGTDEPVCRAGMQGRHREQTYGNGRWGEKREGEANGEGGMEASTWPYVKQTGSGDLLYDPENSPWGSVNLEGWERAGGGREVRQGGDVCTPLADSRCCVAEMKPML